MNSQTFLEFLHSNNQYESEDTNSSTVRTDIFCKTNPTDPGFRLGLCTMLCVAHRAGLTPRSDMSSRSRVVSEYGSTITSRR